MVLLFVLLLLILVFAMAFSLAETWDQVRGRFIVIIAATALVITGALVGLRYWFTFSTGCVPNCTGANLVGRDLEDQVLSGANFVEANLSNANLAGAQSLNAQSFNEALWRHGTPGLQRAVDEERMLVAELALEAVEVLADEAGVVVWMEGPS